MNTPKILKDKKTGRVVEEQIRIANGIMPRIKVNSYTCTEFISAMQNARYPQRKEGTQSTTENTKPIHDWTSHFRTSFEYLALFLTELEAQGIRKAPISRVKEIGDPITGELRRINI